MSAFVVGKDHINAIIQAGLNVQFKPFIWYCKDKDGKLQQYKLIADNADEVGQMLLDENVHSVRYRYEDSNLTDLPGPLSGEYLMPFQWKPFVKMPTPIEAIKAIRCYQYQSCEHPEWEISEAKAFSDTLIDYLVAELPGYDEAPWTWEDANYYRVEQPIRLV